MGEEPERTLPNIPGAEPGAEALARAGLRAKRTALVLVSIISLVFIAMTCFQVIPAVFGAGFTPIPAARSGSPERTCSVGINALLTAPERAGVARAPLSAPASALSDACAETPEGRMAWAALQRMHAASEQPAGLSPEELSRLRADVAAHLPADLR